MAQLVAALITVHGLLSFLSDVYGLLDPSGKTLWLSVDHRSLGPVNDMVFLSCVVGESGFVLSRIGRTEYQLLLTKASNRGRNIKILGNYFGCV